MLVFDNLSILKVIEKSEWVTPPQKKKKKKRSWFSVFLCPLYFFFLYQMCVFSSCSVWRVNRFVLCVAYIAISVHLLSFTGWTALMYFCLLPGSGALGWPNWGLCWCAEDIEQQVVSVILELASPSSHDDYRTEAVAVSWLFVYATC